MTMNRSDLTQYGFRKVNEPSQKLAGGQQATPSPSSSDLTQYGFKPVNQTGNAPTAEGMPQGESGRQDQIAKELADKFAETKANPYLAAYKAYNELSDDEKESFFNNAMKILVKAPAAGIASAADLVTTLPYNAYVAASNALGDAVPQFDPLSGLPTPGFPTPTQAPFKELQPVQSLEQTAEEGVDNLTGGRTKGGGPLYEGVKLASSLAVPGLGGAKLAQAGAGAARNIAGRTLKAIGSDNPKIIASAIPAGAAMDLARSQDVGALGQLGAGIGASTLSQGLLGINKNSLVNAGLALGGIGKKGLKTDVIDAGKRIGVDIPMTGATDSTTVKYLSGIGSKAPYVGDKLRKLNEDANTQFRGAVDDLLYKVGKPKEQVQAEISQAYNDMRTAAQKATDDLIDPSKILNQISSIEKGLDSIVTSDVSRNLKRVMDEIKGNLHQSTEGIENLPKNLQEQIRNESVVKVPLEKMISSKEQLNEIMRDKNLFGKQYPGRESQLRSIAKAIDDSLESYGQSNPDFLTKFRKANKLYADTMKREKIDDLLDGKLYNAQGEVSYASLSKVLQNRKNQNFLKNNLGVANYKKLADFAKVAEGIAHSQKNVLNPSGTATFGMVAAGLGYLASMANSEDSNKAPFWGSIAGIGGAAYLLTNKRFLKAATELAKKPTVSRAEKFWKAVEDRTGITYQEYVESMKKDEKDTNP